MHCFRDRANFRRYPPDEDKKFWSDAHQCVWNRLKSRESSRRRRFEEKKREMLEEERVDTIKVRLDWKNVVFTLEERRELEWKQHVQMEEMRANRRDKERREEMGLV